MSLPDDQRAGPLMAPVPYHAPTDEVSLVDLALILEQHRVLILAATLGATLLGGALALIRPPVHVFTSPIEIARTPDGPIESPALVASKLNESYIPLVRHEYGEKGEKVPREFRAEAPKDSDIVLVRSRGPLRSAELHAALHHDVVEALTAHHEPALQLSRRQLQTEMAQLNSRLVKLRSQNELLKGRLGRLAATEEALRGALKETREAIDAARETRRQAAGGRDGESSAALIMAEGDLGRLRDREQQLSEELMTGIGAREDAIREAEIENLALQADAQEKLAELELKERSLRGTAMMMPTLPSENPTGMGRSVLLALSLMLGVMAGVLLAFLGEFRAQVRARRSLGGRGS